MAPHSMPSAPCPQQPSAGTSERYEDFSEKQKRGARTEWDKFVATRSPEELAEFKRLGVTTSFCDDHDHIGPPEETGAASLDANERPSDWENLRVDVDFAGRCDTLADELQEKYKIPFLVALQIAEMIESRINEEVERRKSEQLQTIAAFMIAPGNARKRALGLAYVANLDALNGIGSQEKAGKQTLSSRASINAEANKWRDLFGMPQNGHMKKDAARETFSKDKASNNHWRRKKVPAQQTQTEVAPHMLTKPETNRLTELETVIEDNMQTFYAVGQALTEIQEGKLYRAKFGNFEDYCVERWDFRRNYAYRLIEAVKVIGEMSPAGIQLLPSSERQARALATVPKEQRGEVWTRAVDAAGGGQPSSRQINEAADPESAEPPSPFRITKRGLEFTGEITDASLAEAMRALKLPKDSFHCALADLMKAGAETLGDEAVGRALEASEYDHDDVMRADALNHLPPGARELGLSASHYVVVVKAKELTTDAQRMDWLRKAKKHSLTPLQLKRSILAGKIVTSEDVQIASGRGSGILTIENVAFQASQWHKHIEKADPISAWEPEKARGCLEKLKPVFAIINELMAAAKVKKA